MFRMRSSLVAFAFIATSTLPLAQDAAPEPPNYKQANLYSAEFLRERTYSTSVQPNWIGETDRFWYSYRDRFGTRYCLVDPAAGVKSPLFDHERIAAELSIHVRKPHDPNHLSLVNAKVDDEGKILSFVFEKTKFELDLTSGELVNKGEASEAEQRSQVSSRFGRRGNTGRPGQTPQGGSRSHRNFSPDHTAYVFSQGHNLYYVEASDEVKAEIKVIDERMEKEKAEKEKAEKEKKEGKKEGDAKTTDEGKGKKEEKEEETQTTEEKTKVEDTKEKVQEVELETTEHKDEKTGDVVEEEKVQDTVVEKQDVKVVEVKPVDKNAPPPAPEEADERDRWALEVDESKAIQLTTDGEEDYSFGGFGGFGRRSSSLEDNGDLFENAQGEDFQYDDFAYDLESRDDWPVPQDEKDSEEEEKDEEKEEPKTRPSVTWAKDSTAFYGIRRDSRGVAELFLVNSIAEPRPALEQYKYPMPGEEKIRKSELYIFDRTATKLKRFAPKWKDEGYTDMSWTEEGHQLRMMRRDRLLRNIELLILDPTTMTSKVLIEEGFEEATISPKSVRYLDDRKEMVWWSERSGWGHFYLYDQDGKLKNAITSGPYLASSIVEVDEEKGMLYFRGNSREAGENTYYQHLYRVFLDGTGLALMDSGNATHRSSLSPTQSYLVDNCSRIDMAPVSFVRDSLGNEVMKLEEADLSRLYEAGWEMPETFTVKAADGVTDLHGNMWKPFDFNPKKSYPIIAEVYPGPQTEGVSHTFSASNGRQQLAQIGFIVIQVGHRGGTPTRSKQYHSYGYFNLRDYGLADKKSAIEQLARRHSFIDVDRVGLYGHSGGGFMTAAALMLPPYNEFFKVGVSSAGNHDNNIYNNSWSERYHGLREVEVEKKGEGQEGRGQRSETRGVRVSASVAAQDGGQRRDRGRTRGGETEGEGTEKKKQEKETRFEIHIPTNQELAENLKGNLLLVHGEIDNNVHPANTMRLVDALIKANKRFDLLIIPGARHGFGAANGYFNQRKWEFFAEHLLGDHQAGAEISVKE